MFSPSKMFLKKNFAHENMKKPASKVAKPAQIQPKSQFLFHKNLPLRDFSIMTLCIMNLITFTESCKYICFRVVQRAVLEVMKPCNDWKTHLADVMKRPNQKVQLCCAHRQFHFTVDYILNTSYLTDTYISFTLKLESR